MGQKVLKVKHAIDPDDVYVHVTCTETGKNFRFSLDGAETHKFCRSCGKENFIAYAQPVPGHLVIDVQREDVWSQVHDVPETEFTVELDES